MKAAVILICILWSLQLGLMAQSSFVGQLRNDRSEAVVGGHIKNLRTGVVTHSDTSGRFEITANLGDTLMFSAIGHQLTKIVVPASFLSVITLRAMAYDLRQVEVIESSSWSSFKSKFYSLPPDNRPRLNVTGLPNNPRSNVPIPYRSQVFVDKPTAMQQLNSPFSSLYYRFSKKEKSKRKVWAQIQLEQEQSLYFAMTSRDSLTSYLPIDDGQLDEFILFCNIYFHPKELNDAELIRWKLKGLFDAYQKSKKED